MEYTISRHPADALPQEGPVFVVCPAQESIAPAELYRRSVGTPLRCAAGSPLAALIRSALLSTPDQIAVKRAEWMGPVLNVDLEIRKFVGDLAANDPWFALVMLQLGRLEPGSYEAVVSSATFNFRELHHPEKGGAPSIARERFRFQCDGDAMPKMSA